MTSNEIKNTNDSDSKKKNVSKTIQQENQAKVYLKSIRVSPIKLNLVVSPIRGETTRFNFRGEKVEKAINYLSFSNKRIAIQVKKALQSAIANAENNHQLDVDKLYISEISVGKGMVMKRFRARARGRGAKILKPFSNLTIKLKEREKEIIKNYDFNLNDFTPYIPSKLEELKKTNIVKQ